MQTLKEIEDFWVNTEECTRYIHESFCELVNNNPKFYVLDTKIRKL